MRALGFDVKKAELQGIMNEFCKDSSGLIAFDAYSIISQSPSPSLPLILLPRFNP